MAKNKGIAYDHDDFFLDQLGENTKYNLNQGVFKDHFYYGKALEKDGQQIDAVVFDDGSMALDLSGTVVEVKEEETKRGTKKIKVKGENQIKALGMEYRFGLSPLIETFWSNNSIENFRNHAKGFFDLEKSDSSVVSEENVGCREVRADWVFLKKRKVLLNPPSILLLPTGTTLNYTKGYVEGEPTYLHSAYGVETKGNPTPTAQITLTTLTKEIVHDDLLMGTTKLLEKYIDVQDNRIFFLAANYILATYCFEIFDSIGYLFFNSESGSGKTKFMDLIGLLCFNPLNATSPSEAALFRSVEATKCTMLIDDFEKIPDEKRNSIEQILKVGYKKRGQTIRTEKKNDNWVPVGFDVYSPKIITNTTTLDPVTLSRCIVIHLLKTLTNKGRLAVDTNDPVWQVMRDSYRVWTLLHWREVRKNYLELDCPKLNNRDFELVRGLLAVAKTFSEDYFNQLYSFVVECFKDRDLVDLIDDWEYNIYAAIFKNTGVEETWHMPVEIHAWVKAELDIVDDVEVDYDDSGRRFTKKKAPSSRWIGKKLHKNPLFRKRRVSKGVEYLCSSKLAEDYILRRGWPEVSE